MPAGTFWELKIWLLDFSSLVSLVPCPQGPSVGGCALGGEISDAFGALAPGLGVGVVFFVSTDFTLGVIILTCRVP